MRNLAMERKLQAGELVDVSDCPTTPDGDYILHVPGQDRPSLWMGDIFDYADCVLEVWIWSIGIRKNDGVILASTTSKFYQNQDFKCIWLR